MTVDPVLTAVAGLAIAWLFAHAAWHKVRAFGEFSTVLASYRLMPDFLLKPAAILLVALEATIAAGASAGVRAALAGAALLLGLYAAAIGINLLRDRALLDCGCGGPAQPISWGLVVRNVVLMGTAGLALLPTTGRSLGLQDAAAIAAALLVAGSLYAAANTLHAARAQLEEWI